MADMNPFYTTKQVSKLVGVSCKTLQRWRKEGTGPPFACLGIRTVRYPKKAFWLWVAEYLHNQTDTEIIIK